MSRPPPKIGGQSGAAKENGSSALDFRLLSGVMILTSRARRSPPRRPAAARRLAFIAALVLAASSSSCSVFISLPMTPRLQNLSEEMVFAMAPAPEWPQVVADNPATAPVDISCGVGPRTTTGLLYAAISVRGRPPSAALAPLNVSVVLDRSGSMAGAPFRNMLIAAQTFIAQLRDGDRVSVIAFSDGVYEAVPPVVINAATRPAAIAGVQALQDGGGTYFSGGMLAGLAEVFSAFQEWQVNQVILFSDGQPNIGITSSPELTRIAGARRRARRQHHHDRLRHGPRRAPDAGPGRRVGRQLLLRRQPQRHAGHLPARGGRDPAQRRARDRHRSRLPPGLQLEEVIGYDYVVVGQPRLRAPRHRASRGGALRGLPLPPGERRANPLRRGLRGSHAARALRRLVRADDTPARTAAATTGRWSWPGAPRRRRACRRRWPGQTPAASRSSSRSSATRAGPSRPYGRRWDHRRGPTRTTCCCRRRPTWA